METLWQDTRFAVRQLLKHKSFTLVAVLTLALGIGANTAIFSVVYGVLLRPLPYPEPSQIVGLRESARGNQDEMGVTYNEFLFLAERDTVFQSFAASTNVGFNVASASAGAHLRGMRVSRGYFRVLGVAPRLGRDFVAEEDQPAGPPAIILSHGIWQRLFGGDSSVVGRSIPVDGVPTTVVGVMPAGFQPLSGAEAWGTLAQVGRTVGSGENLSVIGRLARGTTVAQASNRSQVAFSDFRVQFKEMGLSPDLQMALVPYSQLIVTDVQAPVKILFVAIGFVLLIACANVASLLLGRAESRHRELAVRVTLGAGRGRIIRQLLTESLLLALAGGIAAIAVATWGLQLLLGAFPAQLPRTIDVHIDRWALMFTFGIALVTGLAFGLVPAWLTARGDPHATLKNASTRTAGSSGQSRLRNVLVTVEMALALVLLTGAGLMIRTFANLMHIDPGFDVSHALSAEIWLTGSRYDSPALISEFYRNVTTRIDALPGVKASAVVEAGLPLERGGNMGVRMNGERLQGGIDYRTVTPGYFNTLGVPFREGRDFSVSDGGTSTPVVVVNQSFARRYLRDGALGRSVSFNGDSTPRIVVGVVGDLRSYIGFDAPAIVFLPSAQTPAGFTRIFNGWFPIHVVVRTAGDPAALAAQIARAIQAADPLVPIGQVRPMGDVLGQSLALQRFVMVLLSVFAGLAITLAIIGIYGLISWFVMRSTRDIGVRIALGATPGKVVRMVLRRGMTLAATGATIGVLGALALARFLGSLLFNVKPADPVTLALVTLALAVVAAVACYIPARRAARLDPVTALRTD